MNHCTWLKNFVVQISVWCRNKIGSIIALDVLRSFTKTTALVTAGCFLYTSVFSQALHAIVSPADDVNRRVSVALNEFSIPYSLGRITDAKYLGSERVVINIQDLHCHAEVQKNISKILSIIDKEYGLSRVYVEGGIGAVDTSWVKLLDDKKYREKVVETLLNSGVLTGSEYYSILSEKHDLLQGIEDADLYTENIVRLGTILEQHKEIQSRLPELARSLDSLKARYYSSRNRKLDDIIAKHDASKLTTEKYYKLLLKLAGKTGVDLYQYPTTSSYLNVIDLQKELSYRKISKQLTRFLGTLRQRIPFGVYQQLMEKASDKSRLEELYVALVKVAKEYKLDLTSEYKELNEFFTFVDANQKINPVALVREEKQLLAELHARMAASTAEREAAFLSDFFEYVEAYLNNKISAEDYDYYVKHMPEFKELWAKYIASDNLPSLEKYYEVFDKFYSVNVERNTRFLKHIFGKETPVTANSGPHPIPDVDHLSKVTDSLKNAKEIFVVVTGGFHTNGLTELLKDRDVSYMVITPNVTQDAALAEASYTELAKRQAKLFSTQAFALYLWTLMLQLRAAGASDKEVGQELATKIKNQTGENVDPAKILAIINEEFISCRIEQELREKDSKDPSVGLKKIQDDCAQGRYGEFTYQSSADGVWSYSYSREGITARGTLARQEDGSWKTGEKVSVASKDASKKIGVKQRTIIGIFGPAIATLILGNPKTAQAVTDSVQKTANAGFWQQLGTWPIIAVAGVLVLLLAILARTIGWRRVDPVGYYKHKFLKKGDYKTGQKLAQLKNLKAREQALGILFGVLFHDERYAVRCNAAQLLRYYPGNQLVIQALLNTITSDKSEAVVVAAMESMDALDKSRTVDTLLRALKNPHHQSTAGIRVKAAGLLAGYAGNQDVINALAAAVRDSDPKFAWAVTKSLYRLAPEKAVAGFIAALKSSEDSAVRIEAATVLSSYPGNQDVINALTAAIENDQEADVVRAAVISLKNMSQDTTIEALHLKFQAQVSRLEEELALTPESFWKDNGEPQEIEFPFVSGDYNAYGPSERGPNPNYKTWQELNPKYASIKDTISTLKSKIAAIESNLQQITISARENNDLRKEGASEQSSADSKKSSTQGARAMLLMGGLGLGALGLLIPRTAYAASIAARALGFFQEFADFMGVPVVYVIWIVSGLIVHWSFYKIWGDGAVPDSKDKPSATKAAVANPKDSYLSSAGTNWGSTESEFVNDKKVVNGAAGQPKSRRLAYEIACLAALVALGTIALYNEAFTPFFFVAAFVIAAAAVVGAVRHNAHVKEADQRAWEKNRTITIKELLNTKPEGTIQVLLELVKQYSEGKEPDQFFRKNQGNSMPATLAFSTLLAMRQANSAFGAQLDEALAGLKFRNDSYLGRDYPKSWLAAYLQNGASNGLKDRLDKDPELTHKVAYVIDVLLARNTVVAPVSAGAAGKSEGVKPPWSHKPVALGLAAFLTALSALSYGLFTSAHAAGLSAPVTDAGFLQQLVAGWTIFAIGIAAVSLYLSRKAIGRIAYSIFGIKRAKAEGTKISSEKNAGKKPNVITRLLESIAIEFYCHECVFKADGRQALNRLLRLNSPWARERAADTFIKILKKANQGPEVRRSAAFHLKYYPGRQRVIDALVGIIVSDTDSEVVDAAEEILAGIAPKRLVEAHIQALQNKGLTISVRHVAMYRMVGNSADKRVLSVLSDTALNDKNEGIAWHAAVELYLQDPLKAIGGIVRTIIHANVKSNRSDAIRLMSKYSLKSNIQNEAINALVLSLADSDPEVVRSVAEIYYGVAPRQATEVFIRLLNQTQANASVRAEAARQLGRVHKEAEAGAVEEALINVVRTETDNDIRYAAVKAASEWKFKGMLEPFREALKADPSFSEKFSKDELEDVLKSFGPKAVSRQGLITSCLLAVIGAIGLASGIPIRSAIAADFVDPSQPLQTLTQVGQPADNVPAMVIAIIYILAWALLVHKTVDFAEKKNQVKRKMDRNGISVNAMNIGANVSLILLVLTVIGINSFNLPMTLALGATVPIFLVGVGIGHWYKGHQFKKLGLDRELPSPKTADDRMATLHQNTMFAGVIASSILISLAMAATMLFQLQASVMLIALLPIFWFGYGVGGMYLKQQSRQLGFDSKTFDSRISKIDRDAVSRKAKIIGGIVSLILLVLAVIVDYIFNLTGFALIAFIPIFLVGYGVEHWYKIHQYKKLSLGRTLPSPKTADDRMATINQNAVIEGVYLSVVLVALASAVIPILQLPASLMLIALLPILGIGYGAGKGVRGMYLKQQSGQLDWEPASPETAPIEDEKAGDNHVSDTLVRMPTFKARHLAKRFRKADTSAVAKLVKLGRAEDARTLLVSGTSDLVIPSLETLVNDQKVDQEIVKTLLLSIVTDVKESDSRTRAIELLSRYPVDDLVLKVLQDVIDNPGEEETVAWAATRYMDELASKNAIYADRAVAALSALLKREDRPAHHAEAAERLGNYPGNQKAVDALLDAISSYYENPNVVRAAAASLKKNMSQEPVKVVRGLVKALAIAGNPSDIQEAERLIQDQLQDDHIRQEVKAELIALLKPDEDSSVRRIAARFLKFFPNDNSDNPVVDVLTGSAVADLDQGVRQEIISSLIALHEAKDQLVVPAILKAIGPDVNPDNEWDLVQGLYQIDNGSAIDSLVQIISIDSKIYSNEIVDTAFALLSAHKEDARVLEAVKRLPKIIARLESELDRIDPAIVDLADRGADWGDAISQAPDHTWINRGSRFHNEIRPSFFHSTLEKRIDVLRKRMKSFGVEGSENEADAKAPQAGKAGIHGALSMILPAVGLGGALLGMMMPRSAHAAGLSAPGTDAGFVAGWPFFVIGIFVIAFLSRHAIGRIFGFKRANAEGTKVPSEKNDGEKRVSGNIITRSLESRLVDFYEWLFLRNGSIRGSLWAGDRLLRLNSVSARESAFEALIYCLENDQRSEVLQYAADKLRDYPGNQRAADALFDRIKSYKDNKVADIAIESLLQIAPERRESVVAVLLGIIASDTGAKVVEDAEGSLKRIAPDRMVDAHILALQNEGLGISARHAAIYRMAENSADEKVLSALSETARTEKNKGLAWRAAVELHRLDPRKAIAGIVRTIIFSNEKPDRRDAVLLMSNYSPDSDIRNKAINTLVLNLAMSDLKVAQSVAEIYKNVARPQGAVVFTRLLNHPKANVPVRAEAARQLGEIVSGNDTTVIDALVNALGKEKDPEVCEAIRATLKKFPKAGNEKAGGSYVADAPANPTGLGPNASTIEKAARPAKAGTRKVLAMILPVVGLGGALLGMMIPRSAHAAAMAAVSMAGPVGILQTAASFIASNYGWIIGAAGILLAVVGIKRANDESDNVSGLAKWTIASLVWMILGCLMIWGAEGGTFSAFAGKIFDVFNGGNWKPSWLSSIVVLLPFGLSLIAAVCFTVYHAALSLADTVHRVVFPKSWCLNRIYSFGSAQKDYGTIVAKFKKWHLEDVLLRDLASNPDPERKATTVMILGDMSSTKAIQPLIDVVKQRNAPPEVRINGIEALAKISKEKALRMILEVASANDDASVLAKEIEELTKIVLLMDAEDASVKYEALRIIREVALDDAPVHVCHEGILALEKIVPLMDANDASVVDVLDKLSIMARHDPNDVVREAAISALFELRKNDALPVVREAVLGDPSKRVRDGFIGELNKAGGDSVVDDLEKIAMYDPVEYIRMDAAKMLYERDKERAKASLIKLLESTCPSAHDRDYNDYWARVALTRREAISAMVRLLAAYPNDQDVAKALSAALEISEWEYDRVLVETLKAVDGKSAETAAINKINKMTDGNAIEDFTRFVVKELLPGNEKNGYRRILEVKAFRHSSCREQAVRYFMRCLPDQEAVALLRGELRNDGLDQDVRDQLAEKFYSVGIYAPLIPYYRSKEQVPQQFGEPYDNMMARKAACKAKVSELEQLVAGEKAEPAGQSAKNTPRALAMILPVAGIGGALLGMMPRPAQAAARAAAVADAGGWEYWPLIYAAGSLVFAFLFSFGLEKIHPYYSYRFKKGDMSALADLYRSGFVKRAVQLSAASDSDKAWETLKAAAGEEARAQNKDAVGIHQEEQNILARIYAEKQKLLARMPKTVWEKQVVDTRPGMVSHYDTEKGDLRITGTLDEVLIGVIKRMKVDNPKYKALDAQLKRMESLLDTQPGLVDSTAKLSELAARGDPEAVCRMIEKGQQYRAAWAIRYLTSDKLNEVHEYLLIHLPVDQVRAFMKLLLGWRTRHLWKLLPEPTFDEMKAYEQTELAGLLSADIAMLMRRAYQLRLEYLRKRLAALPPRIQRGISMIPNPATGRDEVIGGITASDDGDAMPNPAFQSAQAEISKLEERLKQSQSAIDQKREVIRQLVREHKMQLFTIVALLVLNVIDRLRPAGSVYAGDIYRWASLAAAVLFFGWLVHNLIIRPVVMSRSGKWKRKVHDAALAAKGDPGAVCRMIEKGQQYRAAWAVRNLTAEQLSEVEAYLADRLSKAKAEKFMVRVYPLKMRALRKRLRELTPDQLKAVETQLANHLPKAEAAEFMIGIYRSMRRDVNKRLAVLPAGGLAAEILNIRKEMLDAQIEFQWSAINYSRIEEKLGFRQWARDNARGFLLLLLAFTAGVIVLPRTYWFMPTGFDLSYGLGSDVLIGGTVAAFAAMFFVIMWQRGAIDDKMDSIRRSFSSWGKRVLNRFHHQDRQPSDVYLATVRGDPDAVCRMIDNGQYIQAARAIGNLTDDQLQAVDRYLANRFSRNFDILVPALKWMISRRREKIMAEYTPAQLRAYEVFLADNHVPEAKVAEYMVRVYQLKIGYLKQSQARLPARIKKRQMISSEIETRLHYDHVRGREEIIGGKRYAYVSVPNPEVELLQNQINGLEKQIEQRRAIIDREKGEIGQWFSENKPILLAMLFAFVAIVIELGHPVGFVPAGFHYTGENIVEVVLVLAPQVIVPFVAIWLFWQACRMRWPGMRSYGMRKSGKEEMSVNDPAVLQETLVRQALQWRRGQRGLQKISEQNILMRVLSWFYYRGMFKSVISPGLLYGEKISEQVTKAVEEFMAAKKPASVVSPSIAEGLWGAVYTRSYDPDELVKRANATGLDIVAVDSKRPGQHDRGWKLLSAETGCTSIQVNQQDIVVYYEVKRTKNGSVTIYHMSLPGYIEPVSAGLKVLQEVAGNMTYRTGTLMPASGDSDNVQLPFSVIETDDSSVSLDQLKAFVNLQREKLAFTRIPEPVFVFKGGWDDALAGRFDGAIGAVDADLFNLLLNLESRYMTKNLRMASVEPRRPREVTVAGLLTTDGDLNRNLLNNLALAGVDTLVLKLTGSELAAIGNSKSKQYLELQTLIRQLKAMQFRIMPQVTIDSMAAGTKTALDRAEALISRIKQDGLQATDVVFAVPADATAEELQALAKDAKDMAAKVSPDAVVAISHGDTRELHQVEFGKVRHYAVRPVLRNKDVVPAEGTILILTQQDGNSVLDIDTVREEVKEEIEYYAKDCRVSAIGSSTDQADDVLNEILSGLEELGKEIKYNIDRISFARGFASGMRLPISAYTVDGIKRDIAKEKEQEEIGELKAILGRLILNEKLKNKKQADLDAMVPGLQESYILALADCELIKQVAEPTEAFETELNEIIKKANKIIADDGKVLKSDEINGEINDMIVKLRSLRSLSVNYELALEKLIELMEKFGERRRTIGGIIGAQMVVPAAIEEIMSAA